MTRQEVYKIIGQVLNINPEEVTPETGVETAQDWDSLAHINILTALDERANGKISEIDDFMDATSVKKICEVLVKNDLLS
ncbi:MAG: acyl carrier protein [Alphaproteobacteria bacterium]|jgi:acyl carrier protein|nr:acyl carrier protein [Alphaproteobacteria bacterium]